MPEESNEGMTPVGARSTPEEVRPPCDGEAGAWTLFMQLTASSRIRRVPVSRHLSFTTAIAVFLFAAPLAAQHAPSSEAPNMAQDAIVQDIAPVATPAPVVAPSAVDQSAASLAPTRSNGTVGVRTTTSASALTPSPIPAEGTRSGALMFIGGAGLLVGALIGGSAGTVIMVAGGVIGLIGLWNYLNY